MNRVTALAFLVCLSGCANPPTAPTATAQSPAVSPFDASPTMVAIRSEHTGETTSVVMMASDPQPPTCAWRDMVVAKHIALGGNKNDIVTLANLHQVYLMDTWDGSYVVFDYPRNWCI